jgi:hypothetical protein
MATKSLTTDRLTQHLQQLMSGGITADAQRLKKDMCTQFADPREWAREYVTNAYDAAAMHVWIGGSEDKAQGNVTISVVDDGHGMNRKEVLDFMTVYRSSKRDGARQPIGVHGIGKLSIAAIPDQTAFSMITSTGSECWRFQTGSLLEDRPIEIEGVEPVPQAGTRFDITFQTTSGLAFELRKIREVLVRYCRFLPLEVIVYQESGGRLEPTKPVYHDWYAAGGRAQRSYCFSLKGKSYEASFGLGSSVHELYQNRVMITSKYNLLFHGQDEPLALPTLQLRVDSPHFELPFGRHCLRDESELLPLANHLREECLMDYLRTLLQYHSEGDLESLGARPDEVEAIACRLIQRSDSFRKVCQQVPMFLDVTGRRYSLADLQLASSEVGALYLESEHGEGLDYSVFEAPVLCRRQPSGGLDFLQTHFSNRLVLLGLKDVVMEAPRGVAPELGPRELAFQRNLRFHPKALEHYKAATTPKEEPKGIAGRLNMNLSKKDVRKGLRMCQEAQEAQQDLESLQWRVSYLVSSDGRTPCRSRRFLLRDQTVVLNLYHPEVEQLVALAQEAPSLSGHWGLAMALTDPTQRLLEHLSHEARDDLILADAVAKCRSWDEPVVERKPNDRDKGLRDFLRNRGAGHFGLLN